MDSYIILTTMLFISLGLIGIGFLYKKKEKHFIRISGWILFGVYWLFQAETFIKIHDYVNAFFSYLALPFFLYISYNEYLSYKWKEEHRGLKFLAGTTFIAGGVYFIVDKFAIISKALIIFTAKQTVFFLNLISEMNYSIGEIGWNGIEYYAPIPPSYISIILACTAIQSMLIFIGGILATEANNNKRVKAFLISVPPIYVLNIVRNVGIIYGVNDLDLNFDYLHGVLGKGGGLIVLIVLAFLVFKILPELHENILSLVELHKRKKPTP